MENWIWQVRAIKPEAADIKTIFLDRRNGEPVPYQAGQFLTLLFTSHGHDLRRSYSFSTSPAVDAVPAISVKRVANGEVSRRLLDHLRVGDPLLSLAPAGRFTLDKGGGEDLRSGGDGGDGVFVFIAAGSGLVPIFSLAKELRATRPGARVLLLSQQHDESSTPFRAALRAMDLEWAENLTVRAGRLTKDRLADWIDTKDIPLAARFYLCGPPDFMRWVQIGLRTFGVADDRIKREHFTVGVMPPAPPVFDASPKKVVVRAAVDREFTVTWPESILTAAIRQGVPLPYSCRAGRCSSCVAHCVSGSVRMTNNEVLTEKDLTDGLVLTCVGYAGTDIVLDYARSSATKASGSS